MSKTSRAQLKMLLIRHYAAQTAAPASEAVGDIASAMLAEDARAHATRPRHMGFAAFVAAQVGYVPVWTWVAQIAIIALMFVMALTGIDADSTKLSIGVLSAATVLVGVPTVQASKLHGVAELECSCPNNAASVMVARLIVLGCSSAFVVSLMVATTAAHLDLNAFTVALWAAPPFFCSCAGCLLALRKASPSIAMALCVTWIVMCSVALLTFANVFPEMYGEASIAVWAGASALALAWLAREVAMTLRATAAGFDAFAPHMAKINN